MKKIGGFLYLFILLFVSNPVAVRAESNELQTIRRFKSANLNGWETVVGDGLYLARGESTVKDADIATINCGEFSEMLANLQRRRVMAHNITFKRIHDDKALEYIHTYGLKFRLPFKPAMDITQMNGETVEFSIFVWDGKNTRTDYGAGFQWKVNPWDGGSLGLVNYWKDEAWAPLAKLNLDNEWHDLRFVVNFKTSQTLMVIDGVSYPLQMSKTKKSSDWSNEISARVSAEIISLYPGSEEVRVIHQLEVKDWYWNWNLQPDALSARLPDLDAQ